MSRTKKKDEHISSPSPSAQITVPLDEFQQHLEFFRSVCQFLQKISKDYSPIQVLDALNGQAVTSLCAARCVLRAREKESICFDDLVEIIQRQECDSQFDGETIAYKLAVIDRMENPYLVFDQQVGKKRLVSTQRANSATDFYSKIRNLYSYSVTNLPTFRLLGLIPPEGASWGKLHDSTKRANISVPHTDFTTWFSVKLAGLVFMRTVEQKGDLYFLTDYGRESLEQLALTSSGNSLSAQSRFGRGLERPSSQREFFQEAWAFLQKQERKDSRLLMDRGDQAENWPVPRR